MPRILIDADACPVKDEVYKVAWRHDVPVTVVANSFLRLPDHPLLTLHTVGSGFDAADDWIAEHAGPDSIVITGDILLAERCVKAGASVLGHDGRRFTEDSIGAAVATRAIMADLRAGIGGKDEGRAGGRGGVGGPPPFRKEDRSRFLSALDESVVRLKRPL